MTQDLRTLTSKWTKGTVFGGFSLNAGYYSGRPPTTDDINTKLLEGIYAGLKEEVSPRAASNFARFVNNLNDLSASSFVVALEQFWARDCKITKIEQHKEDRTRITAYGDAALGQAFGAIAEVLSGRAKSEDEIQRLSAGIKRDFVSAHEKEIPDSELHKMSSRRYW